MTHFISSQQVNPADRADIHHWHVENIVILEPILCYTILNYTRLYYIYTTSYHMIVHDHQS